MHRSSPKRRRGSDWRFRREKSAGHDGIERGYLFQHRVRAHTFIDEMEPGPSGPVTLTGTIRPKLRG